MYQMCYLQGLEYLSEGLEGRSPSPVALLWDALMHPDADMGVEAPPLVTWKYQEEKSVSHLVLGKMKAGGAWQVCSTYSVTLVKCPPLGKMKDGGAWQVCDKKIV